MLEHHRSSASQVTMEVFNSNSTAQGNAVEGPLRDLTGGAAPKASKSDFASNVSRFFESRKMKATKNPPPPPARITKATTQNSAVLEKVGQKLVSPRGSGPFYDDAWDIRMARLGLQTSASTQHNQQRQQGGRGPPDGAATCESTCSLTSTPSSAKTAVLNSTTVSDSDVDKVMATPTTPTNATISTFTSSAAHSASQSVAWHSTNPKAVPTGKSDVVLLPAETDPADGVATPTPLNNSSWFPPPPPTPLHLSLHADDPVDSQPGRYHEHRRSFEMDDDQKETKVDPGDAITLPPLSPASPPQENNSVNGGGRTSVASFLLNLPPPPPVAELSTEQPPSPPVIPPRDPKTSVTTLADPPITDLDGQPPVPEATPVAKQKEESEKAKAQCHQPKSGIDGRSVVPWERVVPPTATAIDFSGNLPQWVPPQHSEATALHYRASRSIGHRSSKSQSGCEDLTDEGPSAGALGHAAGGRSQSQHRGRRRTTRSFGDDFVDAAETRTNGSSGSRRAVCMNSDSSGMAKARTLVATGDVWAAAVACDDLGNESAGQFVRVGCNMRQHPGSRSSARHQRPSGTNQHKALAAAAVANADMMTQSLIDWPGCDDASPNSSGLHNQRQQQRICRRMKAVHLTDSGLVLSPQDATSLPVYHGRQVFFPSSSSNTTSPGDVPPGGGYFFQSQVSCPPHLGGKMSADDGVWADGRVFDYQTAPAHAYPAQAYMVWPQHQLVGGQRRRRQQNHYHHPTQPIIVPAGDEAAFPMEKRSTSTKVGVPHNGRPQVLVSGRNRGKRAADLAALVSLPVEEQPWFHGHLPRAEAESLLRSAPPGSFLVRTSETSKAAFSLSIRRDRDFLHMKISYDPKSEAFILGEYSQPYPTVPIMVHHYTRNLLPVRGTKPVLLKYPLCRAINAFALQTP